MWSTLLIAVFSENCTQIWHFPSSSIRTHESGVVHKSKGSTAREKLVTGEDLLRSALAFGTKPKLNAFGSGCFGTIDCIDLGDVIDTFFCSASITINQDQSSEVNS